MSADSIAIAEPTETPRDLIDWLREGATVQAPDGTVALFLADGVLHIFADVDATARDHSWATQYAELAGGDSCEPYEPGIDHFAVTIADGSPLTESDGKAGSANEGRTT